MACNLFELLHALRKSNLHQMTDEDDNEDDFLMNDSDEWKELFIQCFLQDEPSNLITSDSCENTDLMDDLIFLVSNVSESNNQKQKQTSPSEENNSTFALLSLTSSYQLSMANSSVQLKRDDSQPYSNSQSVVQVMRRSQCRKRLFFDSSSQEQPTVLCGIRWEYTLYLNFIVQYLQYSLVFCVCETSHQRKGLRLIKRIDKKIYASPTSRRLDKKGSHEVISYPNIFFMLDTYDDAMEQCDLHPNQLFFVELIAHDPQKKNVVSLFRKFLRYESIDSVLETNNKNHQGIIPSGASRNNLNHRMLWPSAVSSWWWGATSNATGKESSTEIDKIKGRQRLSLSVSGGVGGAAGADGNENRQQQYQQYETQFFPCVGADARGTMELAAYRRVPLFLAASQIPSDEINCNLHNENVRKSQSEVNLFLNLSKPTSSSLFSSSSPQQPPPPPPTSSSSSKNIQTPINSIMSSSMYESTFSSHSQQHPKAAGVGGGINWMLDSALSWFSSSRTDNSSSQINESQTKVMKRGHDVIHLAITYISLSRDEILRDFFDTRQRPKIQF